MDEIALSPEQTATLIDYARRKYAEERYPLLFRATGCTRGN